MYVNSPLAVDFSVLSDILQLDGSNFVIESNFLAEAKQLLINHLSNAWSRNLMST